MTWNVPLCTGWGGRDTHAVTLSDGRTNTHPSAGQGYYGVTLADIFNMVHNPPSVAKDRAQWVIPSSYRYADGRSHRKQREAGQFHALPVDLDKGNPSLDQIRRVLANVVPGVTYLIYTTASAMTGAMKWRVIIPLAAPIAGAEYSNAQGALFDLMARQGLLCDRSLERTGQLVYLPNMGAHWQHHTEQGDLLSLTPDHAIVQRMSARGLEARERMRAAPPPRRDADSTSAEITWFNNNHAIDDLLEQYGYTPHRNGKDWRSPYQDSKGYATRNFGDRWFSMSWSDQAQGFGLQMDAGVFGDAFDLFLHYQHGGDYAAAMRSIRARANIAPKPPQRSMRDWVEIIAQINKKGR